MEIVETLQMTIDEATESIEWRTEKICDIEPFDRNLAEVLITDVDQYGCLDLQEAVNKMRHLYYEEKLRVCIPTNTSFNYKGNSYQLCLCLGDVVFENNRLLCKYGIKHIMDRHSIEHGDLETKATTCSEQRLWNAIKSVDKAISNGTCFIDKQNPDRLVFYYDGLLYVVCYATSPLEVTYLHTVFKPLKDYLKRKMKKRYTKTDRN